MSYVIGSNCVGCHYCAVECPVSCIDFDGFQYAIKESECTDCGICAEICPISIITKKGEKKEKAKAGFQILDCDVLVLGAGGAGLISAVKAAEICGQKVIVLEKAKKPGGSTYIAGGAHFQILNSKKQQEMGKPDTRDDKFRQLMNGSQWEVNPRLVRNFVDTSGPFFDWFMEKCAEEAFYFEDPPGNYFDGQIYLRSKHIHKKSSDLSIGPGWAGSYLVEKVLEECRRLGIDVLTESRARHFITDNKGKVTGVLADTKEGQLKVNCRACVIAAGTMADEKKLAKLWPGLFSEGNFLKLAVPTNTGDSLDMAEEIGAHVDRESMRPRFMGPAHHPFSYSIYRIMRQPEIVYVNLKGERWIDETGELMTGSFRLSKQPKSLTYAIIDSDILEMLGERCIATPIFPVVGKQEIPILQKYREDIEREVANGFPAKKADTLKGLAEKMSVDQKTFVQTIERYNEYCKNGRDLDYFKKSEYLKPIRKAPFYAFLGLRFFRGVMGGGIIINENTEVLSTKGEVMPGLFAAGDNVGGLAPPVQPPHMGGLSWACCSGYMAGIAAANYVKRLPKV